MPSVAVVKFGGAVLTDKRRRGVVDARGLADCARVARAARDAGVSLIIAHGAGSFGHGATHAPRASSAPGALATRRDARLTLARANSGAAEAKACGCARGGDPRDAAFARGVDETRARVLELNRLVVDALRDAGVNARGLTPWREGWRTRGPGRPETSGRDEGRAVLDCVRDGVVPVIHGDVVEDVAQGVSVLSADTIVEMCARWAVEEWPDECPRVVFCSDVFGVYDSPPTTRIINADVADVTAPLRVNETETAVLLRDIIVDADASDGTRAWRCARASPLARLADVVDADALDATFATDDAIADVTGGVRAKLTTAIAIASFLPPGPPRVFLARPGAFAAEPSRVSDHALNAILAFDARGAPDEAALNNFIGTALARRAP